MTYLTDEYNIFIEMLTTQLAQRARLLPDKVDENFVEMRYRYATERPAFVAEAVSFNVHLHMDNLEYFLYNSKKQIIRVSHGESLDIWYGSRYCRDLV